jgi:hypothetical protein
MTISFCFSSRRVCGDQENGAVEVAPLCKKVGMGYIEEEIQILESRYHIGN